MKACLQGGMTNRQLDDSPRAAGIPLVPRRPLSASLAWPAEAHVSMPQPPTVFDRHATLAKRLWQLARRPGRETVGRISIRPAAACRRRLPWQQENCGRARVAR